MGAGGRGFESRYPDEKDKVSNFELIQFVPAFFYLYILRELAPPAPKAGALTLSIIMKNRNLYTTVAKLQ